MKHLISVLALSALIALPAAAGPKKGQAPQPLSPATQVQYLSGYDAAHPVKWDFFLTEGRGSGQWTQIDVPSCWELQGFGTYQYGMPFYGKANPPGIAREQGRYRTSFRLPAEWEGRVIRLVFEGVMTDCSVDINNRRGIKLHQGSFYRFSADVSDRVYFGNKENTLSVLVSKESANESVNMAERRGDFWNFGGIFRPVYIEALPAFYIDRCAIDAKADGSFLADVYLGFAMDETYSIETRLTDLQGKAIGQPVTSPVRGDKAQVKATFPGIKTWSAETPNLYYADIRLMRDGKVCHQVRQRFGFRTIELREHDGLYINGQKVLMKGVNRHSFRPETGRALSYEDNLTDVKLMKEMNMNAVRMSHYPPDAIFLDYCDSLGLYVMDELCGWHYAYDTQVGTGLVTEMVTRDVNHPSIIWWSNGNEGGFNEELEPLYYQLDPQQRAVLYPWANKNGYETKHYRSYGETQEYMRKPEVFMPTEFLHGLYDGGHGGGLWDYWEMMRLHPRSAGGFLWDYADEGVMRTDLNGKIDCVGNYGADGIVGPHLEKEGSFFTIRQVWSPIHVKVAGQPKVQPVREDSQLFDQCSFVADPEAFGGRFIVENRYDFTNLKDCRFEWQLAKFGFDKAGHETLSSGKAASPDIAPHANGTLSLSLPANWKNADALYLSAYAPDGTCVYTWAWYWKSQEEMAGKTEAKASYAPTYRRDGDRLIVTTGSTEAEFDTTTGMLCRLGKLSLSNGPRFIAARRNDRSMDVFYNHDDKFAKSKERVYTDISGTSTLTSFDVEEKDDTLWVKARYFGNLHEAFWAFDQQGGITLHYAYQWEGNVELCGVCFDYPEDQMQGVRFLAKGPYRVWENRLHGTLLDVWDKAYNDPIPGETFDYPEFKGYFNDWKWACFTTGEGQLLWQNLTPRSYLGIYTPRDGRDRLLYTLPQSGLAVLDVIPGVRNKVNSTDLVGPSSLPKWLSGEQRGCLKLSVK